MGRHPDDAAGTTTPPSEAPLFSCASHSIAVPSILSGGQDCTEVYPWAAYDASSRHLTWHLDDVDPGVTTVDCWLADEGDKTVLVGIGWSDGRVEVVNVRTRARVVEHRAAREAAIARMLFAPDGKTLWYVCGYDNIFAVEVPIP